MFFDNISSSWFPAKNTLIFTGFLKLYIVIVIHNLYTFVDSKEYGLHLIFNSVSPEGPAWACGARPGDVIKTINYWKVYLMDQPHVSHSLN